eukprot:359379-Chlamydomonas_euryale.AAC.2
MAESRAARHGMDLQDAGQVCNALHTWRGMARHDKSWHGMAQHDKSWHGMAQHDKAPCHSPACAHFHFMCCAIPRRVRCCATRRGTPPEQQT